MGNDEWRRSNYLFPLASSPQSKFPTQSKGHLRGALALEHLLFVQLYRRVFGAELKIRCAAYSMTSPALRKAAQIDVSALTAIRRDAILALATPQMGVRQAQAWAESSAEDRISRAIEHHDVWVAERDGLVVGWVEVGHGRVEGIYVRPDFACRGIGSTLLLHAESLLRVAGHTTVTLDASSNAEEFYVRHGYQPQSRQLANAARPMLKYLCNPEP